MTIEVLGLVISIILGTIGHFLYDLTNHNKLIGFFFSTNESTFEHIKLGITPILLWMIVELFTINFKCLLFIKLISIFIFVITLLFLYYGYKIIFKKNILFLDILIFYISLSVSFYLSIKMLLVYNCSIISNIIGFIGLLLIITIYKITYDKNVK